MKHEREGGEGLAEAAGLDEKEGQPSGGISQSDSL